MTNNVAIFWDFETCPLIPSGNGFDIVAKIHKFAHNYGSVTTFKAYYDTFSCPEGLVNQEDQLQSSGILLMDCMNGGVIKYFVVDILVHAIDNPASSTTIIILSCNEALSYSISSLVFCKYNIVVVTPSGSASHEALSSLAYEIHGWENIVLKAMNRSQDKKKPSLSKEEETFPVGTASALGNKARIMFQGPQETGKGIKEKQQLSSNQTGGSDKPLWVDGLKHSRPSTASRNRESLNSPQYGFMVEMGQSDHIKDLEAPSLQPQTLSLCLQVPPYLEEETEGRSGERMKRVCDFQPLVEILWRLAYSKGQTMPLQSVVGLELVTSNGDVYKNAGVPNFSKYVEAAERESVVILGGHGGSAWISLHVLV